MQNRWIATLCFLATAPTVAAAQFTTFIAPPKPALDSIQVAADVQQQVTADSIARSQIQNMKRWVDSAAGIVVPPADTAFRATMVDSMTPAAAHGVLAPNTASPLPFLLAVGLAALVAGVVLARRQNPAPRRADQRQVE